LETKFKFDRSYLEYYQDRLERASDGTRVPGLGVTAALVERMRIAPGDRVLDVGCSFGRLLPVLQPYSKAIFGGEMSYDVVDVAARREYQCVVRGTAEDSNLPSGYFSHVVLFGVFDCCNQWQALRETRRLLASGGSALLTGKNSSYPDDDRLALIAERNAFRKSFPNSFTHVGAFGDLLPRFGFEVQDLLRFERRGDFGELRTLPDDAGTDVPFYEFAAILRATGEPPATGDVSPAEVSTPVSATARRVSTALGFADPAKFFASDRLDVAG
jgi:SAM-dependent methyltransferase